MNVLQYSNGWGHLVMSIVFTLAALFLIVFPDLDHTTKGVGVSILLTVVGAWFIPGAAKQVIAQMNGQQGDNK